MITKWDGWIAKAMDRCVVRARVRDERVDDVKATIIK